MGRQDLMRLHKDKVKIDTDKYVNEAVESVLAAEKYGFEQGRSYKDALIMKVLMVDQLENMMTGLGMITKEPGENGELGAYAKNVKNFLETEDIKKEEDRVVRDAKIANFKFRLLLEALKMNSPSEITFTL